MSGQKCLACVYLYQDAEDLRAHQKSEWHRHNLKRRVASLPPYEKEFFEELVRSKEKDAQEKEPCSMFCETCNKRFKTKAAYDNHLPSKHHKSAVEEQERRQQRELLRQNKKNSDQEKGMEEKPEASPAVKDARMKAEAMEEEEEEDSDAESWESWEDEPLSVSQCLFCPVESADLETNMEHMTLKHSLFLPDAEYLVDVAEFVQYLGKKVGVGHQCLWCPDKGKSFYTVDAVQKHMRDKNHCRILFEGDSALEYADFYDYRKSYPDDPDGEAEEKTVPVSELESDGFELHLPSGATIGHRSLQRYYKQNLQVCQRKGDNPVILSKLLAKYRALGWTGASGVVVEQRRKDLGYMQRLKFRQHMNLGIKANKLQHHFRNQNPI